MKATPMMGLVALQDPRWAHPQRGLPTASRAERSRLQAPQSGYAARPPLPRVQHARRWLHLSCTAGSRPPTNWGRLVRLQDDQTSGVCVLRLKSLTLLPA